MLPEEKQKLLLREDLRRQTVLREAVAAAGQVILNGANGELERDYLFYKVGASLMGRTLERLDQLVLASDLGLLKPGEIISNILCTCGRSLNERNECTGCFNAVQKCSCKPVAR